MKQNMSKKAGERKNKEQKYTKELENIKTLLKKIEKPLRLTEIKREKLQITSIRYETKDIIMDSATIK